MKKVVLFCVVFIFVLCMSGCEISDISNVVSTQNQICGLGESVEVNGFKISYVSWERWDGYDGYFGPKEGHYIIRAYFICENIGDKDKFIGRGSFDCYADGYTTEKFSLGDEPLDSYDSLSVGRKMEGYVYFEIPEDAKEIEIEYNASSIPKQKVIFKVVA